MLFILGNLLSITSSAQNLKAELKLAIQKIVIGDYIHATINIDGLPPAAKIVASSIDEAFRNRTVELISADTLILHKSEETWSASQHIIASAYKEGITYFPSIVYHVQYSNGTVVQVNSDSMKVEVSTVAVDTTKDIKPIQDIITVDKTIVEQVSQSVKENIWWLLGLLIFIIVVYVLWKRLRKSKTVGGDKTVYLTLEEKYLARLSNITKQDYLSQDDYKSYYSDLSDALREYIQERFDVPAPELTTQEFLKQTKRMADLKKHRPVLKAFLQAADWIKFAKGTSSSIAAEQDMQHIISFIKATKQKEEQKVNV